MNNSLRRTLLVAALVLISTVTSFAQLRVTLSISAHPDPYLSNWPNIKNTAIVTVTNSGTSSVDAKFDCKVNLSGSLLVHTKPESMKVLRLSPGVSQFFAEDLVPYEAVKILGNAEQAAVKTGMLPSGFYEFCVSLLDPATNKELTAPVCKNFTLQSYQTPVLLQPENKSELGKGNRPMFRWSGLSPKYPSPVSYRVVVMEVLKDQTPLTAFRVNRPILDKEVSVTQLQWPADFELPHKDMQYVWSVQALNGDAKPIIQEANGGWAEPFLFDGCCKPITSDSNPDKISLLQPADGVGVEHDLLINTVGNDDIIGSQLNQDISIYLITPTESESAQSLTPDFVWLLEKPTEEVTYRVRIAELKTNPALNRGIDVIVVWPINSKVIFEKNAIEENSFKFPSDTPPLDSSKKYIWDVAVLNLHGEEIARSPVSVFAFSSPEGTGGDRSPQSCNCIITPPARSYTLCQGQPFPVFSPASNAFSSDCTGPVTAVWNPTSPQTAPGTYTATCTFFKGGASCIYPVSYTVVSSVALNQTVVTTNGTTFTQCCVLPKFKLVDASGTAYTTNIFPVGTQLQWYITTGLATSTTYYTGQYLFENSCWDPALPATPNPSGWYRMGAVNTTTTTTVISSFLEDAPNYGLLSRLAGSAVGINYQVRCKITLPAACGAQPYYTPAIQITVTENTNMLTASVNATRPTCGSNGEITVTGLTGGNPNFKFRLNSGTPTPAFAPNVPKTWPALAPVANYYVNIFNPTTGCGIIKTGIFTCENCPKNLTIGTSHTIPCPPGFLTLATPTGYNPYDPNISTNQAPYQYQWWKCTACGTCNTVASCNNCSPYMPFGPLSTYTVSPITSPPITDPGCYKLQVIGANGSCKFSPAWYATASTTGTVPIITGNPIVCTGSTTTLSTTATGTLLWSPGGATTSSITATAGTYTVTSTNGGCTLTSSAFLVTSTPAPTAPVITRAGTLCTGVTLTATGATDATFLWSTNQTTASISVAVPGTYSVTQTVNGCTSLAGSITVGGSPCVLGQMLSANNTLQQKRSLAQTFVPTQTRFLTKITHGLQGPPGAVTNYDLLVTTTDAGGRPNWTGGSYNVASVLYSATGLTTFATSGVVNAEITVPACTIQLTEGTRYALILIYRWSGSTSYMRWRGNTTAGSYLNGQAYYLDPTGSWQIPSSGTPQDHGFKIEGECP